MKVKDLINELKKMPQDADVTHIWDGASRSNIECVWLCKDGSVASIDYDEVVYNDSDRPVDAPNEIEKPYWKSPKRIDYDCI